MDICSQCYNSFWEGGLPVSLNRVLLVSHVYRTIKRETITQLSADQGEMCVCRYILACQCARKQLCTTFPGLPPSKSSWLQELALLGGLSKKKATNPAPKPFSEWGDGSITHLGSRMCLDGGDINSSVWPDSWGVQHPPDGFNSTNTSCSQEQLCPIELLMIYYIAFCLFCPGSGTPHRWGSHRHMVEQHGSAGFLMPWISMEANGICGCPAPRRSRR